jgi:hypothetical protein
MRITTANPFTFFTAPFTKPVATATLKKPARCPFCDLVLRWTKGMRPIFVTVVAALRH